ncbi:hypothetical protein QLX08_006692 [Tetragonisca angustula]|uniref:Transposase n=1 Tax=Tetragonisca angustula TaxID=166442 RepID=A0AAW0ZUQ6_9HYME
MVWPFQRADLNPQLIEHHWNHLEQNLQAKKLRNRDELFEILRKKWESINLATIQKLLESTPRRMQAVIDSNGCAIKY